MSEMQKNGGQRAQRGFSMVQLLLATILGAILMVVAIRVAMGQRADAQFTRGLGMITGEVPDALVKYFYVSNRSYAGLTTGSKSIFTDRYGLQGTMPWGDTWAIQSVSPSPGTPTSIKFRFTCSSLRATCAELLSSVTSMDSTTDMITAEVITGSALDVTYSTPR